MIKAVPKLEESESGLMVLKNVKLTYFDAYLFTLFVIDNIYHKQCGQFEGQQNFGNALGSFHHKTSHCTMGKLQWGDGNRNLSLSSPF